MNPIRRYWRENKHEIRRNVMAYGMSIAAIGAFIILFAIFGEYIKVFALPVVATAAICIVIGIIAESIKEKLP